MLSFCPVTIQEHYLDPYTVTAVSVGEYTQAWDTCFTHVPYEPGRGRIVCVADENAKRAWLASWQRQCDAYDILEIVRNRYGDKPWAEQHAYSREEIAAAKHTIEQCQAEMDALTFQELEFTWHSRERSTRWVSREEVSG